MPRGMSAYETTPPPPAAPAPILLETFTEYADIQAAVDRLSDEGFPVETVFIVWAEVRHVERVTGRRTTGRAFLEGAASGAWFGLALGILISLFVELSGISWLALVLWYVGIAALAGGAFTAFGHWMRRGRRDFGSVGYLDAERYELWVQGDLVDRARSVLGVASRRPMDPPPAAGTAPGT